MTLISKARRTNPHGWRINTVSKSTDLIPLANTEKQERIADIIFIHGLGGDALDTWRHPKNKQDRNNYWPLWLVKDFPQMGIWSLAYEVEPTKWKGSTMPLVERADNSLDLLEIKGIGKRPIFFITHSMGGLLVKQMLRNADDSVNDAWQQILNNTRGIVYLATPNSGSNIASFLKFIGADILTSVSVKELEAHHPQLLKLNRVHRDKEIFNQIPIKVYGENKPIKPIGIVVDKTSVDPGRAGVTPIILDRDHISICKPESTDDRLYLGVKQFIEAHIEDNSQSSESFSLALIFLDKPRQSSPRCLAFRHFSFQASNQFSNYIGLGSIRQQTILV